LGKFTTGKLKADIIHNPKKRLQEWKNHFQYLLRHALSCKRSKSLRGNIVNKKYWWFYKWRALELSNCTWKHSRLGRHQVFGQYTNRNL